jgi:hypothetical protein
MFSHSGLSLHMPLSPPVSRQLRHRRAIRMEAFERDDGLWDIEACLTDEKPRDVKLASGVRPQGLPIHELWLRITIDRTFAIVGAEAASEWSPYGQLCSASNPAYQALIGLNLVQNFRRESSRLLAGTTGCTHLTELCAVLPTAAIQAFAGEVWNTEKGGAPGESSDGTAATNQTTQTDKPPFQLGRCNALRFDGEAVRQHYPRWFGHAPRSASDGTARIVEKDSG